MAESPPTAIVVVLRAGVSDVDASILRSWLRMMPQVVDVRPVNASDDERSVAADQVRAELTEMITPIFDSVKRDLGELLDAATGEFEGVVGSVDEYAPDRPSRFKSEAEAPSSTGPRRAG